MIELRLKCDRCEEFVVVNLDEYIFDKSGTLSLTGFEEVNVGGGEYWFCPNCKKKWDGLQTERKNEELKFVKEDGRDEERSGEDKV